MEPETFFPPFVSTLSAARETQVRLRSRVRFAPLPLGRIRRVGAADVTFLGPKDLVAAVIVVVDLATKAVLEEKSAVGRVRFPYVPGYLTFREGPAVVAAWRKLSRKPDVMLFDGHGTAHPRRFGIASHLGVLLSVPSVGCAKKRLVGDHDPPGPRKGDAAPLLLDGEAVGAAVRTRAGVKPVFVSPGHRVSLETAVRLTLACTTRFRLPETTRWAHRLASEIGRAHV